MPWDSDNLDKHFEKLRERANKMFEEMWEMDRPLMMMPDRVWKPALDIYETGAEVIVLVEIAGMKKEAIEVTLKGDVLTISGNRVEGIHKGVTRLDQMEINYGRFQRKVRILKPIESEKVTATYENGFLTVRLPKRAEDRPDMIRVTPE